MTTVEKNLLWTLCLDAVCKEMQSPDGRIGARFEEAKTEAGKIFREMCAEIGDGRPDFSGVRERLGM